MRVVLVALALLLALAGPASAVAPRTSLPDIEDEVMCTSCGIPLNIAESPAATDERDAIRTMIAKGYTKAQVKSELVGTYGPEVLADPGDHGFNVANWLVPLAVVLVGLGLLATLLPRWRARPPRLPATATGAALSAADAQRLDDDLARFD